MPSFNPSAPYFSERLQMRPPVMADLERFYAIFGDPQTQRFNPAGPLTSEAQAASALQERLAVWRQHGYGSWALALRERPDWVIGFGGLSWKPLGAQRTVNLGYRFDTRVWGRGWPPRWRWLHYNTGLSVWSWVRFLPLCARRIRLRGGCWKRLACSGWIRWMTCPAQRRAWCIR